MSAELHEFASRDEACEALSQAIASQLAAQLGRQPEASLVVSGGTSPQGVFSRLAAVDLPWSKVHVLPSDERLVAEDDPASNLRMIRGELAVGRAQGIKLISLLPDADGGLAGAQQRLGQVPRPFTHVMLGMGADGHTASLFPDAPELESALRGDGPLVKLAPPSADQQRISLTPCRLLDARRVSLLIFGMDKLAVLERARAAGPVAQLPVRCILHQDRVPVDIYWAA